MNGGKAMEEKDRLADAARDRGLGAFLGLAVGDALGTTLEFQPRDAKPAIVDMVGGGPFRLKPGEWTDDTSMALCLADCLIANEGEVVGRDLADRFLRWWKHGENSVTGRCFDIGAATRAALSDYSHTGVPRGSKDPTTAGNGGVMRLAPAAIAAGLDVDRAVALARAQSEVTHGALECLEGAELLARVLVAGCAGAGLKALDAGAEAPLCARKIMTLAGGGWRGKTRENIRSTGYVVDTLEAAFWSVGTSNGFEEAILKAVNLADDADSVGAVTGQIAGAIWGASTIPERWLTELAWKERLTTLATKMMRLQRTSAVLG
jgi:ADP-ribosyl-[dinitrogen reductase] hydrolase